MPKNNSESAKHLRRTNALFNTRRRRQEWCDHSDDRNYMLYPGDSREGKVMQCDVEIANLEAKLGRQALV